MPELFGRKKTINSLVSRLLEGRTILLYGPLGGGKTAILEAVADVVKNRCRPCGVSVRTESLQDVTDALRQAYPSISVKGLNPRRVRVALDTAVEADPGVLLLDHLHGAVPRFKGFLRSLMGTGLGVLYAADTESRRDHLRYRSLRLACEEEAVPPLSRRHMHCIAESVFSREVFPYPLIREEVSSLVRIADGRPGWIDMMARLLRREEQWFDGEVLKELLRANVLCKIVAAYYKDIGSIVEFEKKINSAYQKQRALRDATTWPSQGKVSRPAKK